MRHVQPTKEEILQAVQRTDIIPTLVVGLSRKVIDSACSVAAILQCPWRISVDIPVYFGEDNVVVGVVSGTDDLSFWNPILIQSLAIPPDHLQELGQQARIEALREAYAVGNLKDRGIPSTLEGESILCICDEQCPGLRYRLCLLRQRNPASIVLLTDDREAQVFVDGGIINDAAWLPANVA